MYSYFQKSNKLVEKSKLENSYVQNSTDDVVLTALDRLRTEVSSVAVDKLSFELCRRNAQYESLLQRFPLITEILRLNDLQISNSCKKLRIFYRIDFDALNIEYELITISNIIYNPKIFVKILQNFLLVEFWNCYAHIFNYNVIRC